MRLVTHVLFTMGLIALLLTYYSVPISAMAVFVPMAGVIQMFIDAIGHTRNHGYVHRTWVTHDLILSLLTVVAPFTYVLVWMNEPLLTSLITATASLYSHLMLDYMTGGLFILTRRIHGLGIEYDNPVANGLFTLIGVVMLAYVFIYK